MNEYFSAGESLEVVRDKARGITYFTTMARIRDIGTPVHTPSEWKPTEPVDGVHYKEHIVTISATATDTRLGSVTVTGLTSISPASIAATAAQVWVAYAPEIEGIDANSWHPLPPGGVTATAPTGATATLTDAEIERLRDVRSIPLDETHHPVPQNRSRRGTQLPQEIPQQTFPEAKAVAIAIADGRLLRRWIPIPGEIALRHGVKGAMLETKLLGSPLLDWLGRPNTTDDLQNELRGLGLPAVLLLHVVIGGALEQHRVYVKVAIDELIKAIGWTPRSRQERQTQRCEIWRWLLMMDAMRVIGQRRGKYRDPDTREVTDTRIHDALIRVMSTEEDSTQLRFDGRQPPLTITYAPGPWIEQWRGRRDILWYFGDVRRLAAIPAGKPSGAWAQAVGLTLQQLWRERAAQAEIAHVGEDNHPTPRFHKPFTRRELLDLFPPEPTVYAVLDSANPKRAREYWNQAISLLKCETIIGHYQEIKPLSARRQEWANEWLDQPLDIRPKNSTDRAAAIIEIAGRAKSARKARAAHRTRRAE